MQSDLVKDVYLYVYSQQICWQVVTDLIVDMHHIFVNPYQYESTFLRCDAAS